MDGADPDRWSAVAAGWARLWGGYAAPAWTAMVEPAGVGPGVRVLDVGCGSGDLLAHLAARGAAVAGIDPAPGMLDHCRARLPGADLRHGGADRLPWPDAAFDLVTSVNALQFADDVPGALAELTRVTRPGGFVAVSNWAEAARNDLDTIEAAVDRARGRQPSPDSGLRRPGGLDWLLAGAGLTVVASGSVDLVWFAPDDEVLVRGVLLGESPAEAAALAPVVVAAAAPLRTADGGYRLLNAFRYATGRTRSEITH